MPELSSDQAATLPVQALCNKANEITNRVAVRLRDDMQLRPFGTGGGCMYNIRMLALSCRYNKEVDIEEARELLVKAGILFLKTANENEKARPYLENYPFSLKNIELRFFIQNENGTKYSSNKLNIITLINGVLRYKISPTTTGLITIYEETFAEAAAKLNITLTPETGLEPEKDLPHLKTLSKIKAIFPEFSLDLAII